MLVVLVSMTISYRNHSNTQAGGCCPDPLLLSVLQAGGIWEWVSRYLLYSRVRGDEGLIPPCRRRAVFLLEMETESVFCPHFQYMGITGREGMQTAT